jgi:hypothetical protein
VKQSISKTEPRAAAIPPIVQSEIDGNGEQSFWGMLEDPKFNSRGLWDGCMGFDITNNHKRQTATISTFMWKDGAPWNWKVIKTIRGEVIGKSEIEAVLQKYGVIKGG